LTNWLLASPWHSYHNSEVAVKKKKFDGRKEVRAIARERVGTVKPSKVIVPKQERAKPKYKILPIEEE
jgi:hypothetical protein